MVKKDVILVVPTKASRSSSVKIMNQPEVNLGNEQPKIDDEFQNSKQLELEISRKEVEEREKETATMTLKTLWPEWTVERIMDEAKKKW